MAISVLLYISVPLQTNLAAVQLFSFAFLERHDKVVYSSLAYQLVLHARFFKFTVLIMVVILESNIKSQTNKRFLRTHKAFSQE